MGIKSRTYFEQKWTSHENFVAFCAHCVVIGVMSLNKVATQQDSQEFTLNKRIGEIAAICFVISTKYLHGVLNLLCNLFW